jgi:alpha-glucosidase (family GH31 glycosyl hydrolase)
MFKVAQSGGMFFKPTFFEYPEDQALIIDHNDDNFMLGEALLVHPVLKPNVTDFLDCYFPDDIWYNF